ncbi:MAG: ABC transporter substrate-binding protein [Vicinamibacterales bacterium]
MTGRRAVLRALGIAGWLVGSGGAFAQRQPTISRVGALLFASASDPLARKYMAVFRQRLRELGYVEGKTIVIDERFAAGSAQRLRDLAQELADAKMDVVVTPAVAATIAMRQATDTIPIVMLHAGNPVGAGLIASLARPGGNVTGTANLPLGGKHVDLMREVLPRMTRLAILVNPTNAGARPFVANMTEAARNSNLDVTIVEVSRPEDFPQAYASIRNAHADWLHVLDEPMISSRRAQWVEFAFTARLPLSSDVAETARVGGLISYSAVIAEHYSLAAVYVDKILKGAKPADLPVEQPTRYELIVNLRTAKALGLAIPQSVLLRAQEVVQ